LLNNGSAIAGGISDRKDNYISPTVLDGIDWGDPVMEEEIFGPILPVLEFEDLDAAIEAINKRPKPLALYYFSANKKKQDQILKKIPFGGGCINDTLLQFGSPSIPVGGVGNSGIGAYHGKESFITFSNSKGIVKKKTRIDLPLRYPPYEGKLKWLKMVFKI
jgi:aldehyde dehydrogenase (NAD+)